MISIKELLYDIDLKLNKIGSNEHQGIELENKVIALNDAQINLIKSKYSENNVLKGGLDSMQKRYMDLQSLVILATLPLTDEKTSLNSYSANLELLSPKYMLGIPGSEYIMAEKGSCKKNIRVIQVRHGDIHTVLANSNTSPSFEFQETPGVISESRWRVFTDGTFIPKKFHLQYIKYPKKVDFPGYIHFDGKPSSEIDSELPYFLKEEIVDIAVRNLALSTENQNAVQASQIRINTGE